MVFSLMFDTNFILSLPFLYCARIIQFWVLRFATVHLVYESIYFFLEMFDNVIYCYLFIIYLYQLSLFALSIVYFPWADNH